MGQVTVTSSGGALSSPVVTPDPLDFSGVTNFTSTAKVYQTTTHSGNNWIGLGHDGTNSVVSTGAGAITFKFTNTQYSFSAANPGTMTFTDNGGANPVILARSAAAGFQMGVDVNGAAVPQTFMAHNGITGTDIAGASMTIAPGKGTGAAVSGSVILNRDLVGATGTTAQTQGTAWVSCPSKILSNTTGTAQTIATITTTSTTAGAINMFYTVTASNGTVLDADSGEAQVAWNNNAGTVAATMAAAIGGANSAASGTLATAPTATVATNVVSIKFTPAWTVIVPTVVTGYATFAVNGVNSIACQ